MIERHKIDIKGTKSSTYLLPIYDMYIDFEFHHLLKNSYLINNEDEKLFSVLYNYSGKIPFQEYEARLMNHPLFAGHEDYGEFVLYKFNYNDVIKKAQDLFVIGRYSWYSVEQKDNIHAFMCKRGFKNAGRVRLILDRSPIIRKEMEEKLNLELPPGAELSSSPYVRKENFSSYVTTIGVKTGKNED